MKAYSGGNRENENILLFFINMNNVFIILFLIINSFKVLAIIYTLLSSIKTTYNLKLVNNVLFLSTITWG